MTKQDLTTREHIIQVAKQFFMTQGYQSTSTRQIANHIGITQPNLYHHFRSKEELYIEVLNHFGNDIYIALSNLAHQEQSVKERLIAMTVYLRDNDPIDVYTMHHEMHHSHSVETKQILYKIFKKNYQQPFVELFAEQPESLRAPYTPEELVSHYFMVIAPYISTTLASSAYFSAEKLVDLVLYGMFNPEAGESD